MSDKELMSQIESLPPSPGVYLFKDQKGEVLYVGKAKELRKRVKSYFQGKGGDIKTSLMLAKVAGVDHIATQTEREALLLEDALIKEHHPRYNVKLRDDKRYPLLRLDLKETYPRLAVVRRTKEDGALYFGPFPSATAMRETLRALQKAFPLRRCPPSQFAHRSRPCLNYQMKRCLAPCCQLVGEEEYKRLVDQVRLFLEGKSDLLAEELRQRMTLAAERLNFEEAARIRDRLAALERVSEGQRAVSRDSRHRDILGFASSGGKIGIQLLFVRGGRLLGGQFFTLKDAGIPHQEVISSFLRQFYAEGRFIPEEILLTIPLEDAPLIEELLGGWGNKGVRVYQPQKGDMGYELLLMAQENARGKLCGTLGVDPLEELKERFHLAHYPSRIEGFDISNLGGGVAVGSMVAFAEGVPVKAWYRHYRIKTVAGMDDYAMLYEVLLRRLKRGKEEEDLPDLILIDGGKGQLNVALEVIKELGIQGVECLAIAKKREKEEDRVFLPNRKEPIPLRGSSPAVRLLQQVRDEAHRFALSYHKRLRRKGLLASTLDGIPGIGAERKKSLLSAFEGLEGVRRATVDQLAQVAGINKALAQRIWEHFHPR